VTQSGVEYYEPIPGQGLDSSISYLPGNPNGLERPKP